MTTPEHDPDPPPMPTGEPNEPTGEPSENKPVSGAEPSTAPPKDHKPFPSEEEK